MEKDIGTFAQFKKEINGLDMDRTQTSVIIIDSIAEILRYMEKTSPLKQLYYQRNGREQHDTN